MTLEGYVLVKRILLIGNDLHINIIRSLIKHSGCNTVSIDSIKRKNTTNILSLYSTYINKIFNIYKYRYDALHILYPAHKLSFRLAKIALGRNIPVILHWVGSDVLLAEKRKIFTLEKKIFKKVINIVVAPWLKTELEKYDLHVNAIIPLVPVDFFKELKETKWPDDLGLIYYLPKGREELYRVDILRVLSKRFSNIKFYVVGTDYIKIRRHNIEVKGIISRQDMAKMYESSIGLVRMPRHDGLPLMVLEALLMQRYVIYNKPIEISCVQYVEDVDDAIKVLSRLVDKYQRGKLKPNKSCRDEVIKRYNPSRIGSDICEIWE